MDAIILRAKVLTATLICVAAMLIFLEIPAYSAQHSQSVNANIAPERDYDRETMTFPAHKKANENKPEYSEKPEKTKTSAITQSIVPMIVMAVIVLGIFLWICLSIVKKLLPGGKKLFSSPGLEILGRTHFDSQKYLALVRVGTRVLIVGVSPNGFDQISEITDSEEITEILSTAKPKTSTGQNLFYKMFQKQMQSRNDADQSIKAAKNVQKAREEIRTETAQMNEELEPGIVERQERIRKIRDLEA